MIKKLILTFLLMFSTITTAETALKIFTLQHRFANDLLPIVSPMVGVNGTATGLNNQLIIRTSSLRMQEIEKVVAALDKARESRKITVRSNNISEQQQARAEISGNVRIGNTNISNRRNAPASSGRMDIERNSSQTIRNSDQFINVLDGERAFIRVGKIVSLTQEWISVTQRYVNVQQLPDWREVSTGFAVRPRSVGNQVELEITSRISKLNGQVIVDFEQLSTTIRVALGSWVDISSTMQANDEISRKILGLQQSSI